ncbi:hypothetical protein B0A55_12393, partial [Friedmanniomyces simplex]
SIAERYASILGIPQSDITFTFEDGTKIRLHDEPSQSRVGVRLSGTQTARTLRTLGITDGTVIMAEPKMINITVRDLMMKEEKFTFYTTDCFGQLGEVYADLIRIAANKLIFTVSSRYWGTFDVDQSEKEAWGDYLHNLGIRDGDVITVKPKVDPSYDISFTIRDAMNKESSFTLKSTATVDDLGDEYELRAWMRASTLQFELEGFVFGSYPAGHGEDTIEQIGIYDGALVTVRPYEQIQQESPAQTKSSIYGDDMGNGTECVGSRSVSPDFNTRKNVQSDTGEQDPLAKCCSLSSSALHYHQQAIMLKRNLFEIIIDIPLGEYTSNCTIGVPLEAAAAVVNSRSIAIITNETAAMINRSTAVATP